MTLALTDERLRELAAAADAEAHEWRNEAADYARQDRPAAERDALQFVKQHEDLAALARVVIEARVAERRWRVVAKNHRVEASMNRKSTVLYEGATCLAIGRESCADELRDIIGGTST